METKKTIEINEDTYNLIKKIRLLMKTKISPLRDDTIINCALKEEIKKINKENK